MPLFANSIDVIRELPIKWGYCRACMARIEWVTTVAKRKRMPIDWPLVPLDTFEGPRGEQITTVDTKQSHFATCPYADEFRTPKARALPQSR